MQIPQPRLETVPGAGAATVWRTMWHDAREGLGYIWNWPALRYLVTIAAILNLLYAPAFALMPLLVREHFQQGALELGYLNAAWGVGIVLGGLLLMIRSGGQRGMRTAVLALIGQGLMLMLLPASPPNLIALAIVGLFLAAVSNAITNGLINAFMLRQVDPSKQGRIFTALSSLCGAMMPLGMALAGPVAEALGARAWFFAASIMTVVLGALTLGGSMLRELERSEQRPREGADDQARVMANIE